MSYPTTFPAVLSAFERYVATLTFAAPKSPLVKLHLVFGDDFRALASVDRMGAVMVLPTEGPEWAEGSRCAKAAKVVVTSRWPVTEEGRGIMLDVVERMPNHIFDAAMYPDVDGSIAGLRRAEPGKPGYRYGLFPGQNTCLALVPVALEYDIQVGGPTIGVIP